MPKTLKLRELIENKYGKANYELGLQLVAQWMEIETGESWEKIDVRRLSEQRQRYSLFTWLPNEIAVPLCKLFGLKNHSELFNQN